MGTSSVRDDLAYEETTDSSSSSGIRPRVSLGDVQRDGRERATVVFRGTFPIEGVVHFIRRHAQARLGSQPLSARVEAHEGRDWVVSLSVEGIEVVGRANNPFVAALRAFALLH
jgi:hypothetical protein